MHLWYCEYVEDGTVESVVPCTSNDSSVIQDYMSLFDIDSEVMDCNVATVESAENCFEFHQILHRYQYNRGSDEEENAGYSDARDEETLGGEKDSNETNGHNAGNISDDSTREDNTPEESFADSGSRKEFTLKLGEILKRYIKREI